MLPTTAIILAAGRGLRMGGLTEETPKGLIRIGGEPLVRRSVALLRAAGVARIRIVTGHLHARYAAEFDGDGAGLELVFNPDFANTGSLRSLAVGLEDVGGPVLVLESDIIYEPRALDQLSGDGTAMLLSGPTEATDEVFTWVCDRFGYPDQLLALSKSRELRAEPHLGEMTGLQRIDGADVPVLKQVVDDMLAEAPRSDYEPSLVALAQRRRFDCRLIPDLAWAEIDDPAMLARAERLVWPRIRAATGRPA